MRKLIPLVIAIIAIGAGTVLAKNSYLTSFNGLYGTGSTKLNSCSTCHTAVPALNPYGLDVQTEFDLLDDIVAAFQAVEDMDSDGDGASNIVEIANRTFPGDASDTVPVRGARWGAIKSLYR